MGTPAWKDDELSEWSGELGELSASWLRRITDKPALRAPSDALDPTDILHSAQHLFGLRILVCDLCYTAPNIFCQYDHDARQIHIDWRLFSHAVGGQVTSRVVDVSPAARFVIGWCIATDMVGDTSYLRIGYIPRTQNFTRQELKRVAATWEMCSSLFLPESRLVKQCEEYDIPYTAINRMDWRSEVSKYLDPEVLITLLAQRNNCLRLLAEIQLERFSGLPMLAHIFTRLYIELPWFQRQAILAGKAYAKSASLTQGMIDVRFSL